MMPVITAIAPSVSRCIAEMRIAVGEHSSPTAVDLKRSQTFSLNKAQKGVLTMPNTGEKPGKGTYECTACGQEVVLDDHDDTLPPCPSCSKTTYRKVN